MALIDRHLPNTLYSHYIREGYVKQLILCHIDNLSVLPQKTTLVLVLNLKIDKHEFRLLKKHQLLPLLILYYYLCNHKQLQFLWFDWGIVLLNN